MPFGGAISQLFRDEFLLQVWSFFTKSKNAYTTTSCMHACTTPLCVCVRATDHQTICTVSINILYPVLNTSKADLMFDDWYFVQHPPLTRNITESRKLDFLPHVVRIQEKPIGHEHQWGRKTIYYHDATANAGDSVSLLFASSASKASEANVSKSFLSGALLPSISALERWATLFFSERSCRSICAGW